MKLETRRETSPLEYRSSDDVQRFALFSPDLLDVPFEHGDTCFAEVRTTKRTGPSGRPLKKPRVHVTPGAPAGTVAFLDWHTIGPGGIYIDYLKVRRDLREQGFGRRLVADFYETVVVPDNVRFVDWGSVMSEAAWKVYQEAKRRYPNIQHHGKV